VDGSYRGLRRPRHHTGVRAEVLLWQVKPIQPADSLTFAGLESCDDDRAAALGLAQAAELTAELRRPLADVSGKAGRMEREAPLFFGQGDNPTLF